jgi:hypothetical protein
VTQFDQFGRQAIHTAPSLTNIHRCHGDYNWNAGTSMWEGEIKRSQPNAGTNSVRISQSADPMNVNGRCRQATTAGTVIPCGCYRACRRALTALSTSADIQAARNALPFAPLSMRDWSVSP